MYLLKMDDLHFWIFSRHWLHFCVLFSVQTLPLVTKSRIFTPQLIHMAVEDLCIIILCLQLHTVHTVKMAKSESISCTNFFSCDGECQQTLLLAKLPQCWAVGRYKNQNKLHVSHSGAEGFNQFLMDIILINCRCSDQKGHQRILVAVQRDSGPYLYYQLVL